MQFHASYFYGYFETKKIKTQLLGHFLPNLVVLSFFANLYVIMAVFWLLKRWKHQKWNILGQVLGLHTIWSCIPAIETKNQNLLTKISIRTAAEFRLILNKHFSNFNFKWSLNDFRTLGMGEWRKISISAVLLR